MLMKHFAGLFTTPSCQQERCLDDSIKVKKKLNSLLDIFNSHIFSIKRNDADDDPERILFCCCNKEDCNRDFAWEPGTHDAGDSEESDDSGQGDGGEELVIRQGSIF